VAGSPTDAIFFKQNRCPGSGCKKEVLQELRILFFAFGCPKTVQRDPRVLLEWFPNFVVFSNVHTRTRSRIYFHTYTSKFCGIFCLRACTHVIERSVQRIMRMDAGSPFLCVRFFGSAFIYIYIYISIYFFPKYFIFCRISLVRIEYIKKKTLSLSLSLPLSLSLLRMINVKDDNIMIYLNYNIHYSRSNGCATTRCKNVKT